MYAFGCSLPLSSLISIFKPISIVFVERVDICSVSNWLKSTTFKLCFSVWSKEQKPQIQGPGIPILACIYQRLCWWNHVRPLLTSLIVIRFSKLKLYFGTRNFKNPTKSLVTKFSINKCFIFAKPSDSFKMQIFGKSHFKCPDYRC